MEKDKTESFDILKSFKENLCGTNSEVTVMIISNGMDPILKTTSKEISEKIIELINNGPELIDPEVSYSNWKLRIKLKNTQRIKDKLTVRAGEDIVFEGFLDGREELSSIEYTPKKREEEIVFTIKDLGKPITRHMDFAEYLGSDLKVSILEHNCSKNTLIENNTLNIAIVQLKYDIVVDDGVIKLTVDDSLEEKWAGIEVEKEVDIFRVEKEAYWKKVRCILEALKGKAKIVVFPEFSIPFGLLTEIQAYADDNGIIVVAGTHYVTENNLKKYKELFASDFIEDDFRKNICPVVMPNSQIVHNEKIFGAKEERALFFHKGMEQGKVNHIFKLWHNLNLGVLICFEYLNSELRNRLISKCNIILVPQANPHPEKFYETANHDLNVPFCAGNKVYIMANGIFRIQNIENERLVVKENEILGGCSGVLLTLDKYSNTKRDDGVIFHKEQFVLLTTINMQYYAARDLQIAPEPIKTAFMHIFEEKELCLSKKENGNDFLTLVRNINACQDRNKLKNLIENGRSLIAEYSPLMYESLSKIHNLKLNEMKEKCQIILIPVN